MESYSLEVKLSLGQTTIKTNNNYDFPQDKMLEPQLPLLTCIKSSPALCSLLMARSHEMRLWPRRSCFSQCSVPRASHISISMQRIRPVALQPHQSQYSSLAVFPFPFAANFTWHQIYTHDTFSFPHFEAFNKCLPKSSKGTTAFF